MNTMMMALLQGRLRDAASTLQQQLRACETAPAGGSGEATLAGELSKVFDALDALQAGRYGLCGACGQALEPDQLLLQPHRLRCAACDSAKAPHTPRMRRASGLVAN